LHVLGTPPALILSQDQTLRLILVSACLIVKDHCRPTMLAGAKAACQRVERGSTAHPPRRDARRTPAAHGTGNLSISVSYAPALDHTPLCDGSDLHWIGRHQSRVQSTQQTSRSLPKRKVLYNELILNMESVDSTGRPVKNARMIGCLVMSSGFRRRAGE
jgi:hypothetical protein